MSNNINKKIQIVEKFLYTHNEIIFNIYGENFEDLELANSLSASFEFNLTNDVLNNLSEEDVTNLIINVCKSDHLYIERMKLLKGNLILDSRGLQIYKNSKGEISYLKRLYVKQPYFSQEKTKEFLEFNKKLNAS